MTRLSAPAAKHRQRTLVVENVAEAKAIMPPNPQKVVVLTQTTLSVDDTREIIEVFKQRFPKMITPAKEDICYATQNRQDAVKQLALQSRFGSGHRFEE